MTASSGFPPLPGYRPATSSVHYTTNCNTQSSALPDGQNNWPKHVELIGIINILLLSHLIGCLNYSYQWCTVKQISNRSLKSRNIKQSFTSQKLESSTTKDKDDGFWRLRPWSIATSGNSPSKTQLLIPKPLTVINAADKIRSPANSK